MTLCCSGTLQISATLTIYPAAKAVCACGDVPNTPRAPAARQVGCGAGGMPLRLLYAPGSEAHLVVRLRDHRLGTGHHCRRCSHSSCCVCRHRRCPGGRQGHHWRQQNCRKCCCSHRPSFGCPGRRRMHGRPWHKWAILRIGWSTRRPCPHWQDGVP